MEPSPSLLAIFNGALDHDDQFARSRYFDEACGANAALRDRVEGLLRAHDSAGGFLSDPQRSSRDREGSAGHTVVMTEKPGEMIGRYRLLQQIGEGGCGVVYMAEQEEPVRRRVALKIIRLGMDTKDLVARFEVERQALALMDHPYIAKVFDAGFTESGRPYFVMELVKGVPITQFCDDQLLGMRERLQLFGDVCSAINHAHQKGVIHRDIKPSNVMVTRHGDKAIPKIIDFGIAKAFQGKLTDLTLFTCYDQLIGTPVYMSPEQATTSGLDIDTRSDIYALGVLLYELLTGKPPFDAKSLASAGFEEMRRIIREVEPPTPSSRLSTILGSERATLAKARHSSGEEFGRLVEPDLDWIVMKAIEKDRNRRYETANGLALDIKRFLADEPVSATPPSPAYRFRKFARRHRTALRLTALTAAVMVAATIFSVWQAVRATKAERLAEDRLVQVASERDAKEQARQEATWAASQANARLEETAAERDARETSQAEAEAVSGFLVHVFQSPDNMRDGRTIRVVELLDQAIAELDTAFSGRPSRRAQFQSILGTTYQGLGLHREAIRLREKARDYMSAHFGTEHPATILEMERLAHSYYEGGRWDEAIVLQEVVLRVKRQQFGPEDPATLWAMTHLALSLFASDRKGEALQIEQEVLRLSRITHGSEHPDTLAALGNLSSSYAAAGLIEEVVAMLEEALRLSQKSLGEEHESTLSFMNNLAASYAEMGRSKEALEMCEKVYQAQLRTNGPHHQNTLGAMTNLAQSYDAVGRLDEAVALQEKALALKREELPPNHPYLAVALGNLADLYEKMGRLDESAALRKEFADKGFRRTESSMFDPKTKAGAKSKPAPAKPVAPR